MFSIQTYTMTCSQSLQNIFDALNFELENCNFINFFRLQSPSNLRPSFSSPSCWDGRGTTGKGSGRRRRRSPLSKYGKEGENEFSWENSILVLERVLLLSLFFQLRHSWRWVGIFLTRKPSWTRLSFQDPKPWKRKGGKGGACVRVETNINGRFAPLPSSGWVKMEGGDPSNLRKERTHTHDIYPEIFQEKKFLAGLRFESSATHNFEHSPPS